MRMDKNVQYLRIYKEGKLVFSVFEEQDPFKSLITLSWIRNTFLAPDDFFHNMRDIEYRKQEKYTCFKDW